MGDGPLRILVVCTANQCRSPMAQVVLERLLDVRRSSAAVASAGLMAGGSPAAAMAVTTMAQRGYDLSRHVSRQVNPAMLRNADLVIGMESRHVREVAGMLPTCWPVTWPLVGLRRRAQDAGARDSRQSLTGWLARLHEGRRTADLMAAGTRDDIADPMGRSRGHFDDTADRLEVELGQFIDLALTGHVT